MTDNNLKNEGLLTQLERLASSNSESSSSQIVEMLGEDYNEVEETDWTQDDKYQDREVTYEIKGRFFCFSEARTGSPYTDWHYQLHGVCEVQKAVVTSFSRAEKFVGMKYKQDSYKAVMTFPSKEIAQAFAGFMSGHGEQTMWEWGEGSEDGLLDLKVTYNDETGDITFTNPEGE